MKRVRAVIALLLWMGACSRSTPGGEEKPLEIKVQRGDVARLELSIANPHIKTDTAYIPITLSLTNTTDHDLWVNKRMMLNDELSPPPFREIWLRILGPDGKPLVFASPAKVDFPAADDYTTLRPGEKAKTETELYGFDLTKPGVYTMVARYRDGNEHPPPPPTGAVHLKAELQSQKVTLDVAPGRK
jgi:hypothetical protein